MQSIIILSINGDRFLFEDNGFTIDQKNNLQNIADLISQQNRQQQIPTYSHTTIEPEIRSRFVDEVKTNLGIDLVPVEVSLVVRINF